jgi:PfaD family protein
MSSTTHTSDQAVMDVDGIAELLARLVDPCYVVATADGLAATAAPAPGQKLLAAVGPLPAARLGSPAFQAAHGVGLSYMAGAMANGVASEDLVVAMARAGLLSSFGAAGLLADRVETALARFESEIPGLPFACNLIHSPHELGLERSTVEACLRHNVRTVEASAFIDVTPNIVRYRVAGLGRGSNGDVVAANHVIGKVSRKEVAARFLAPPPEAMVASLLADEVITAEQADLARRTTMADDITAEADSGGHTDRRPLSVLLPALMTLRDETARERPEVANVRIGAAGGIGTPTAAWAAFAAGADYVVTGSINQACRESGTSDAVRKLLSLADLTDCDMAPAADMFELGVELQVLKRGTFFAARAKKLYALYKSHSSLEQISDEDRKQLETQILGRSVNDIWAECVDYFKRRDPEQLQRAENEPKRRMALVFRWYLGMASRWANVGDEERARDYQIWCGPAMGAFNGWTRGTPLESASNRQVAHVARQIMHGAAVAARASVLQTSGVALPAGVGYRPVGPDQT